MIPNRSEQMMGRDDFVQLLRREFTNFRASRLWMISLLAVVVVFVLGSFIAALASHGSNPAVSIGPDGEAVTDTYTFVHQPLAGDGTFTTRLASLSGEYTSGNGFGASSNSQQPGLAPWAKAGIILEPATYQGTDYAAVMVTGSYGVRMQYNYTHDSPGLTGAVGPSSPRWLRLNRIGDVITGYDSTDGVRWIEIGTARLTGLPHTVVIGLFVTSPLHFAAADNNGTPSVAIAAFDHISMQRGVSDGSWTGEAIGGFYPSLQTDSIWQQQSADTFTVSGSGDIAPLVGDIVFTNWSGASIVDGTIVALLVVIALAALFTTSEHRRPSVPTTSISSSQRVLAAKAIVVGSLAFAAGAIATGIAEVITRHVLAANGLFLFPQSGPDVARVILGTGLFFAFAAVLVVALGTILRRSTATVVAGIALLVVPGVIVTVLPADPESWLMRLTPTAAFAIQATLPRSNLVTDAYTIVNGYFPISPWGGLAVLAAYTAVALGAAMLLLRRRGRPKLPHCPDP
jgi:hypothetical protein